MRGLVLASPHGDMIFEGSKSMVVKDDPLRGALSQEFALIQGDCALGVVKVLSREVIRAEDLEALQGEHQVSGNEYRRWWGSKDTLWGFRFELKERWEPPKRIFRERGQRVLVPDIIFKGDSYYKALKGVFGKPPSAMDDAEIQVAHRILHVFYDRRSAGDRVVSEKRDRTLADIVERHAGIVAALELRGSAHEPPDDDLNRLSEPMVAIGATTGKKREE